MTKFIFSYCTLSFVLLLGGCCDTSNSVVSSGYPFCGGFIELNILEYKDHPPTGIDLYSLRFDPDSFVIKDTFACNNLFRKYDSKYNCNIDFKKYNLIATYGKLNIHGKYSIQKRALINNKTKTCKVEIRGQTKICGSPPITTLYFWDFVLIPKMPDDYTFKVDRFAPILGIKAH